MTLHAVASGAALAVKNGPPGMWRAWSSPPHLSVATTWLLLGLVAAIAIAAWTLWRDAGRRRLDDHPPRLETRHGRGRSGKGVH